MQFDLRLVTFECLKAFVLFKDMNYVGCYCCVQVGDLKNTALKIIKEINLKMSNNLRCNLNFFTVFFNLMVI